jgi:signal transduction histidine kinase
VTVPGSRAGLSGDLTVAGIEAGPADARLLVVAAVPTADLETSRRLLRTLMLVFFPVFLILMALIAWRVIGSALRPVEELRHGAERIGAAADPSERLPVPPSRDEISALAETLNGMLARLAKASKQQRAFVADAAHELRSPLASMRTQLEVAGRLGEGGTLPRDLLAEVDRLTALVEDLLVLARSGEDAPTHVRNEVDVAALLGEVERRYAAARVPVRAQSAVAGVRGVDAPKQAPVVTASFEDLVRALGNLVDNAVRHARTEVTLSWESGAWGTRLTVRDDGNGIPEAERERVFDRFARLDEARDRDSGGSGLGLPITRELLRRNGARVWLEDARPGVRAVVAFGKPGSPPRAV